MHSIGVDVLVAPYEADAQLAYMNKINLAQLIITEDSDLILFGCEKVIYSIKFCFKKISFLIIWDQIVYKLDMNGNGQMVQRDKIISITQFDSADNFERFRWLNSNRFSCFKKICECRILFKDVYFERLWLFGEFARCGSGQGQKTTQVYTKVWYWSS